MPRGEFLLEVRSEEIPARMLEPGVKELATRVFEELMARGLGPREVETGFTPPRGGRPRSPPRRVGGRPPPPPGGGARPRGAGDGSAHPRRLRRRRLAHA